ncbi:dephospho-CoA kinase [Geofilum sp. OHC36d9]|uniref:dephospho-CoA kinase n=1 Tax=Geofilum sp. OHC36d9 TaxID=3458413 RepID=UPI004033B6E7
MKIGVTGGIGSGKSTVCRFFEVLGVPVYDSDARAKQLIHTNADLIRLYKAIFGEDIYVDGRLNRSKVADNLFRDPSLLKRVEALVHPLVRADFEAWANNQKCGLVINEAAVLFEAGSYKLMDKIITVVAPVDLRIQRVMRRDNVSSESIRARMNNQWRDEQKIALSDYIVFADDRQLVIPQILKIWDVLKDFL